MGMFDHVRCRYPLPDPEAQEQEYQSKSMLAPSLDNYVIAKDGRLLHEDYDARAEETSEAPLGFYLHRENCRWVPVDFRGQLEIHTTADRPDGTLQWYSYLLWFKDNRVVDVQRGNSWGQVIMPANPLQGPP